MKKLILSIFVIFTFAGYSLYLRLAGVKVNAGLSESSSGNNPSNISSPPNNQQSGTYKDGQYTGEAADAYYGNVQVQAVIKGGKITDVQFLDYPHDRRTSISINTQAMPYLKSEAIQAQSSNVDIVSGATQTSIAFKESLQSALSKAQ